MATDGRSAPDGDSEALALAIGRYALGEVNEGKAAEIAGLTRWEMRDVLRDAGLELRHGPRTVDGVQENAGLTPGENGSDAE